jgi:hypothetical protein
MTSRDGPAAAMGSTARIVPEAALRPGLGDARALLALWYVRKSSYWVFGLGVTIAALVYRADTIDVGTASPATIWDELRSPLAGVALAVILRLFSAGAGLLITYPLARAYEIGLEPRTNTGRTIGILLDRYKVMRAYRALRWTHHVRLAALRRLGAAGQRLARLDPIMDVANIALIATAFVALAIAGSSA